MVSLIIRIYCIIHIAFILIYALWPIKKTAVAHYWSMAHRLKIPGLDNPWCAQNYSNEKFTILSFGRLSFHLSALEAVYIKSCKPNLCRQKEFVYNLKILRRLHVLMLFQTFKARFHYERGKKHTLFVLLLFFCARFNFNRSLQSKINKRDKEWSFPRS